MNKFTVYVLFSPKFKKIYIGFTSNLEQRIISHNILGKKGWTMRYRPWEIVHSETFDSKHEAMNREKQLKNANYRLWIWSLIQQKYNL
jgi:putative endonuclease